MNRAAPFNWLARKQAENLFYVFTNFLDGTANRTEPIAETIQTFVDNSGSSSNLEQYHKDSDGQPGNDPPWSFIQPFGHMMSPVAL